MLLCSLLLEKDVFKYNLIGSDKAKTLSSKTSVKLSSKGDTSIDSYLLFDVLMALRDSIHKG